MTYFSTLEHILLMNLAARWRRLQEKKNNFGAKIQIFKIFSIDFNKPVVEKNFLWIQKSSGVNEKTEKIEVKVATQ